MLYDYQYEIVGVIGTFILLIIAYQRRSYPSASNKIFFSLLYSNLLCGIVDTFTFWTISYPQRFSIPVLYISNILYMALLGIMAATFFRYITTLIGIPKLI